MDVIGAAAALCVLATFCMQSMLGLRAFAMASNILFIAYGTQARLLPIVLLHAVLLPINGWSLGALWAGKRTAWWLAIVSTILAMLVVQAFVDPEAFSSFAKWLTHGRASTFP